MNQRVLVRPIPQSKLPRQQGREREREKRRWTSLWRELRSEVGQPRSEACRESERKMIAGSPNLERPSRRLRTPSSTFVLAEELRRIRRRLFFFAIPRASRSYLSPPSSCFDRSDIAPRHFFASSRERIRRENSQSCGHLEKGRPEERRRVTSCVCICETNFRHGDESEKNRRIPRESISDITLHLCRTLI